MILIVMRHGEAVDYREPDQTRALSDYGRHQAEQVGKWLNQNLATLSDNTDQSVNSIDVALVSPYLRTQQTYKALAKGIDVAQQITLDLVTPMGSVTQCVDLIDGYASEENAPKSLLIVTHMPFVSLLADRVCSGFNAKIFETASTLVVDYNSQTGKGVQLAFYESPDQ